MLLEKLPRCQIIRKKKLIRERNHSKNLHNLHNYHLVKHLLHNLILNHFVRLRYLKLNHLQHFLVFHRFYIYATDIEQQMVQRVSRIFLIIYVPGYVLFYARVLQPPSANVQPYFRE